MSRIVKRVCVALLMVTSCLSGPRNSEDRARLDRTLDHFEGDGYVVDTTDGAVFAREGTREELRFRVQCPTFAFTVRRTDPNLKQLSLEFFNTVSTLQLIATPGALDAAGRPVEGFKGPEPLTVHYQLRFPNGVDRIDVRSQPPSPSDFTFLAFGDIQTGIDHFDDVISKVNAEPKADFILMLGDLTNASDQDEFDKVESAFERIKWPILTTPGNHDCYQGSAYQSRFGKASYSCQHRGAQFTALDDANAELAPTVWNQLPSWFEEGDNRAHVMFMHVPVTDITNVRSGEWGSRREAQAFLSAAALHKVDLLLFGHIHSYDKYELAGIPAYISGGAGAHPETLDGIGRHYLRGKITGGKLESVELVKVDPN